MKNLFVIILLAVTHSAFTQDNINRNVYVTTTVKVNYWQKKMDQLKEQYFRRFIIGDKVFTSSSSLDSFVKMENRLMLKPEHSDILRTGKFSTLKVSPVIKQFEFMEWALPLKFMF